MPSGQAYLHELVNQIDAKCILEIGTYLAGGTKIIADALDGEGIIMTIESNKDRKQKILQEIDSWPKKLKDVTIPIDLLTSEFFELFKYKYEFLFDLCFVDGDHSYAGALLDLINCSKFASPQAVIIVDDAIQPPVFSAVQDFLKIYPDWTEVGGVICNNNLSLENNKPSFSGLPFLVLVGPDNHYISNRTYSVHTEIQNSLSGINIELAQPSEHGYLEGRFLITHLLGPGPDGTGMSLIDVRKDVQKGTSYINLNLDEAFNSSIEVPIKVAAHLQWQGSKKNSKLSLSKPPTFLCN